MKIMNINLIKNIEYAELLSQPENSKLSKLILKKLKSLPDYEVKQNNFFIECISTKNIMKEQGLDFDEEFNNFKQMFGF